MRPPENTCSVIPGSRRRLAKAVGRAVTSVVFGLQALLWGGGPILEARPAAAALSVVTHIESEGTTSCTSIHSHIDCLVCRTLTTGSTSGQAPELPIVAAACPGAPDQTIAGPVTAGTHRPLGSRAPPAVVPPGQLT
jgi:hypothetical protein